ncbi:hypothetical protein K402DRAFT_397164 [Aulographum hederae CBS 113979]|uniref:Uncharacterized protein n=1 Tax=Aulographum hederae CBS 113979 TaxID=1176131 RepID=A0A6G1GPV3_9PEZI|nr:hypothetical protein K402DRAFT_397164 [Aulographum hederae CBS 113979]
MDVIEPIRRAVAEALGRACLTFPKSYQMIDQDRENWNDSQLEDSLERPLQVSVLTFLNNHPGSVTLLSTPHIAQRQTSNVSYGTSSNPTRPQTAALTASNIQQAPEQLINHLQHLTLQNRNQNPQQNPQQPIYSGPQPQASNFVHLSPEDYNRPRAPTPRPNLPANPSNPIHPQPQQSAYSYHPGNQFPPPPYPPTHLHRPGPLAHQAYPSPQHLAFGHLPSQQGTEFASLLGASIQQEAFEIERQHREEHCGGYGQGGFPGHPPYGQYGGGYFRR